MRSVEAAAATASRILSLCAMWSRAFLLQRSLGPRSVAQLRNLDRAACVACVTFRSRRCRRCNFCGSDSPLRDLVRRQPGHQVQRPVARSPFSNVFRARSPCPQATPSTIACSEPLRDITLTERDKQLLAELRRAPAPSQHRLSSCRGVDREPRKSQWSPVLGCALPLSLPPALGRGLQRHRQKRGLETSQEETSNAAADGRKARETSLRRDSPIIHQQSRERTCGWSSAWLC